MATQAQTTLSERRACSLVGISRTVLHYQLSDRVDTAALWVRLIELAAERRRFGYRRRETLANGRRIKILTIVDDFTKGRSSLRLITVSGVSSSQLGAVTITALRDVVLAFSSPLAWQGRAVG